MGEGVKDVAIDSSWYQKPRKGKVKTRVAAGGVVVRLESDQVMLALVRPRGVSGYVLPKGGVDTGESLEDAARREILEEAGVSQLRYLCPLAVKARLNFKKTRWTTTHYFAFATEQQQGKPLEKARYLPPHWYPLEDFPPLFWPEQTQVVREATPAIYATLAVERC